MDCIILAAMNLGTTRTCMMYGKPCHKVLAERNKRSTDTWTSVNHHHKFVTSEILSCLKLVVVHVRLQGSLWLNCHSKVTTKHVTPKESGCHEVVTSVIPITIILHIYKLPLF